MEFRTQLEWKRNTPDFQYTTYDRTHQVEFGGGQKITSSAAPEYLGKKENVNPEELLVAAASSCHMLTFLAIAAKNKFVVDRYVDFAVGMMEPRPEDGKLWVSQIILKPQVTFSGNLVPDEAKLKLMHEQSHTNCFIAQSIKSQIHITPTQHYQNRVI